MAIIFLVKGAPSAMIANNLIVINNAFLALLAKILAGEYLTPTAITGMS